MVNRTPSVIEDFGGMADGVMTGEAFVSLSFPVIVEVGEDIVISDLSVPMTEVDSVAVGCTSTLGGLLTLVAESVARDVVWLTGGRTDSVDTEEESMVN